MYAVFPGIAVLVHEHWSRLKYLNNRWIDCIYIFYSQSWFMCISLGHFLQVIKAPNNLCKQISD